MKTSTQAQFNIGQIIHHKLFDYYGVIVDVDPVFQASDEWYDMMAKSCPPKDKPWYYVLVHQSIHKTYVAEQNLEASLDPFPIHHPDIEDYFSRYEEGQYLLKNAQN